MKLTNIQQHSDWPELRLRLGALLKQRASDQDLDATTLAAKMGYEPRRIRQLFEGAWRSLDRYQHAARTLGWSVEEALEPLQPDARTRPVPAPLPSQEAVVSAPPSSTPAPVVEDDEGDARPEAPAETPGPTPTHAPVELSLSSPLANIQTPAITHGDMTTNKKKKGASRRSKAPKQSSKGSTFDDHRVRLAGELKALIAASGTSQSTWAKAIGVSQSTISLVLAGRQKRRTHFDNLARELGHSINAEFSLIALSGGPESPPFEVRPAPELFEELETQEEHDEIVSAPTPSPVFQPVESAASGGPARLALDPSLKALVEWSAAQRGIAPQIWLTLAVAAYHEAQNEDWIAAT